MGTTKSDFDILIKLFVLTEFVEVSNKYPYKPIVCKSELMGFENEWRDCEEEKHLGSDS